MREAFFSQDTPPPPHPRMSCFPHTGSGFVGCVGVYIGYTTNGRLSTVATNFLSTRPLGNYKDSYYNNNIFYIRFTFISRIQLLQDC